MLNNLGWGELLMLGLLGLLIFGPDQLPKIAADVGRMIRQLRRFAADASEDLRSELGPEFRDVDLASLNPRKFIEKHVLGDDDDEDLPPKPRASTRLQPGSDAAPNGEGRAVEAPAVEVPAVEVPSVESPAVDAAVPVPYDVDAT
ncbi:MAG: sec-independent translocase [Mycobacteriales bacterium]